MENLTKIKDIFNSGNYRLALTLLNLIDITEFDFINMLYNEAYDRRNYGVSIFIGEFYMFDYRTDNILLYFPDNRNIECSSITDCIHEIIKWINND